MGASLKGRIWSYRVANTLREWVDWCDHIGTKIIDDNISVDEVMKDFIRPRTLEERPIACCAGARVALASVCEHERGTPHHA